MSWNDPDREDTTIYKVVVNHEEQYSIWPEYKENPLGWRDVGKAGPKAECLAFIKDVWTDMRPLSLRACFKRPRPVLIASGYELPTLPKRSDRPRVGIY
jgi:MbtH protein